MHETNYNSIILMTSYVCMIILITPYVYAIILMTSVFAYLFFGHVQEVSEHGPFDGLQAGGCGQAAHVPVVVG